MIPFLKDRIKDYDANQFINELVDASKLLGELDAKIAGCKFNSVLMPMLHQKEALASMYIEGTQTTYSEMLKEEVKEKNSGKKAFVEYTNHLSALSKGADYLKMEVFSNAFIRKIQEVMLNGIVPPEKEHILGRYKEEQNFIVNSNGKVVFEPPSPQETGKYMNDLLDYMNNFADGENPLIKAAVAHAQFESIHPFADGNGRVGRALISLYMYKAKLIRYPYFYFSEAISEDKLMYYNSLTSSREGSLTIWITYFLRKVVAQAKKNIQYIDSMDNLYERTKVAVKELVNSPKYEAIIESLFKRPLITSSILADRLNVTVGQAKRYLDLLESKRILFAFEGKKNKRFIFSELLDLMR